MVMSISLSEHLRTSVGYPWNPSWGHADFFLDTVLFWEWNRHHHWVRLPWFSALSCLTLINWAILRKVTFVGYPWDPSLGPADFFSDTVLFWEWSRYQYWIQQPWFSALSYLTLINWAIVRKVPFLGYPWDPSWGPEDLILDTAGIWGWNSWGHWIQQPTLF